MTYEEAIEYLMEPFGKSVETHKEAVEIAVTALEKQIPLRPVGDNNGGYPEYFEEWIECPKCGEPIPEYTEENETTCYCLGCGQKLDWSSENG